MISIQHALEQALICLGPTHPDARLDAELLLCYVLNKNRAYLFTYPERPLTEQQQADYQKLISQRSQGSPIAYLTGEREFWSLSLKVNEHTLIPRHDTERLVELALELIPDTPATQVLDLGTGSGAIALAIAKERPHWQITAVDRSKGALLMAEQNAKNLNIANVSFYHSDWFAALTGSRYDAILANPPYIAAHDPHLQQGDVVFEPITALVSGQDGLADLHYIIKHSPAYLKAKGLLLLEHGYDQKHAVVDALVQSNYLMAQCWQDIQGNDRVSGGWLPENTA